MPIAVHPASDSDLESLRSLVSDPSLAEEFDSLAGPSELEAALGDPFADPGMRRLAFHDGAAAGFCITFLLNGRSGVWIMLRLGVAARHRRQRVGSSLLEVVVSALDRHAPKCGEVCLSAWVPSSCASGFAAHHGFRHARYYWRMERPRGVPAEPRWPAGVERHLFDGGGVALEDLNSIYNRSFADHYHAVVSSVRDCRVLMTRPGARPDGLLLAYRYGRCVGFCRNEARGEIAALGVAPEARGLGLGRALLRWGIGWLRDAGAPRISLMVDGENETALSLYRSEGFVTVRTREIWSRPRLEGRGPAVAPRDG